METNRLEAFSDGVIAVIITILVLEMKVPHGPDLAALAPVLPVFLSYVLSFVYIGIYWNNHHGQSAAAAPSNRSGPSGAGPSLSEGGERSREGVALLPLAGFVPAYGYKPRSSRAIRIRSHATAKVAVRRLIL